MDINNSLAVLISLGALTIAILNYKRDKSLQNENTLHSKKMDVYRKILLEMRKMLNALEINLAEAENYLGNPNDENLDFLDNQADELDDLHEEFSNLIVSNSLLTSNDVLNLIQNFKDTIYDIETLDSETKDLKQSVTRLSKTLDELYTQADFISEAMRSDLQIDALHDSLFKRLKR